MPANSEQIHSLVHILQLPDNDARQHAELQLTTLIQTTPTETSQSLLTIAVNVNETTAIRQTVLLTLKKVIPLYWSAGFPNFVGPAISQDVKTQIREGLLSLVLTSTDSKVRNSAIYAVIQIAAVDYPDEWPDLLTTLYDNMNSAMDETAVLGGLALLQDLFDDLVTEEQFFSQGVGLITINQCMTLITDSSVRDEVKVEAVKLYRACVLQLQNPAILEDETNGPAVRDHFIQFVTLLTNVLSQQTLDAHNIIYRSTLYNVAFILMTEFPEEYFPHEAKEALFNMVINDIIGVVPHYVTVVVKEDKDHKIKTSDEHILISNILTNILIEQFQFLSSLTAEIELSSSQQYQELLQATTQALLTPLSAESEYLADFNPYVTEEFGFAADFTVRHAVTEALGELDDQDMNNAFQWLLRQLQQNDNDWRFMESVLYFLDVVFRHTGQVSVDSVDEILQYLVSLLTHKDSLVRSRVMLILPSFFQKFENELGNKLESYGQKTYLESLRVASNDESPLVKVSVFLASLTYRDFLSFSKLTPQTQTVLFDTIDSILDDCEEDTPSLLVEVIITSLEINKTSRRALELILKSASKDPSNIQLITEVEEAVNTLVESVDLQSYLSYLQVALPELLATISLSNGEYSSHLALALQLLTSFLSHAPNGQIPESVFTLVYPVVTELIDKTSDDQILQYVSDTFIALLNFTPSASLFEIPTVLSILSKFLDPKLSDSAAMNVGSLVISVISRFQEHLGEILPQILQAMTERLIQAKELSTIEDLLSVVCYMVKLDATQTLTFLESLGKLRAVLQIWFANFTTLRGAKKIRENVTALTKIYTSGYDFKDIAVDGDEVLNADPDLIITRSMRKKLQHVQIPVSVKIVKLLTFELQSQSSNKAKYDGIEDAIDAVHANEDNEGEWEDFEEIGNDFSKLQSYVQEGPHHGDEDEEEHGLAHIHGTGCAHDEDEEDDGNLKDTLIAFFKQIAAGDVNGFKGIYESALNDVERNVLTENIV